MGHTSFHLDRRAFLKGGLAGGALTLSPAFLKRAFAKPNVLKGIICHGLWIVGHAPELVKGRRLVCNNNLYGDALAYGAIYVDEDVVQDGDLITGRTGGHAHLFARAIIERLKAG